MKPQPPLVFPIRLRELLPDHIAGLDVPADTLAKIEDAMWDRMIAALALAIWPHQLPTRAILTTGGHMAKKPSDKDTVIADEAAAEVAYQKTLKKDAKDEKPVEESVAEMHRRIESEAGGEPKK